jgi:uncharacterized protein (TIGR03032 family)
VQEKPDSSSAGTDAPFRSVRTPLFAGILADAGISLILSTYQKGKLVIVRRDAEGGINTHLRSFDRPMGVAVAGNRIAVGSKTAIQEFHNVPAAATKIEPPGPTDAVYLPRTTFQTGDVQVHEMAFVDGELWFINTRFSCLCVRDENYSFVPKWRPAYISELAAGDRCHLNGLAVQDGRVKYVSALGSTDAPGGWRLNKAIGGVVIDVTTNQIVSGGLSMPHSPRWHDGKLWICFSGTGTVGTIDTATGKYRPVVECPGFTRGLAFHGKLGFVGLSQVRETAQFSGIPIANRPVEERACGVWVFDTTTGKIMAFLRFEKAVQEIFAVEILHHRYPDLLIEGSILEESFIVPT